MKKESNVYKLCTNDLKIIETINLLKKKNIYPLPECVYLILKGDESDEIRQFSELPTYKTLVSYSSKKISKLIVMLIRYQYLERIYDENTNELYLKVATKGELELIKYHKKHKYSFTKKKVKEKPLFVIIKNN